MYIIFIIIYLFYLKREKKSIYFCCHNISNIFRLPIYLYLSYFEENCLDYPDFKL